MFFNESDAPNNSGTNVIDSQSGLTVQQITEVQSGVVDAGITSATEISPSTNDPSPNAAALSLEIELLKMRISLVEEGKLGGIIT